MSTIIKSQGVSGADHALRSVAFNLEDLADHGNRYLAEVRRQAESILAKANEDAVRVRRQAAEQGRADAAKAAQQEAAEQAKQDLEQRLATLTPALTAAIHEIRQSKEAWRAHWEKNVVSLATAIASRIIRGEVARAPEVTLTLVREALELAAGATRVSLHLHPADHEALGENVQSIVSQFAKTAHAEVVADADVSPGGCRVVTEFGEIDQRIESQLARIEEELSSA